jgi:hypothetical protein
MHKIKAMDIKTMRKEITELIDNIKQHSDELTDKEHIPQLELELIVSKIEKLYKKSIEFNYVYSNRKRGTEINSTAEETTKDGKKIVENIKTTSNQPNSVNFKNLISINQKYQFISELFNGNSLSLDEATTKINAALNKDEALKIAYELKTKFNWKENSSVADDFIKLIIRKFA